MKRARVSQLRLAASLAVIGMICVVRGESYVVTSSADSGAGSLRSAVNAANSTAESDSIYFAPSLNGSTINLSTPIVVQNGFTISINQSLSIDITITGEGGAFDVINSGLYLFGVRFLNCSTNPLMHFSRSPSAVLLKNSTSGVFAQDCDFEGCGTMSVFESQVGGGAISGPQGSTINVTNSRFRSNVGRRGGAIRTTGTASIRNCTFTGNSAEYGGACYGSSLTIAQSRFFGNSATQDGGALLTIGIADASSSAFSGNSASNGGAIWSGAFGYLRNCVLANNSATISGGGIHSDGLLRCHNSIVWQNEAPTDPDIVMPSTTLEIVTSILSTNVGPYAGLIVDPQFVDPDGVDNVIGTDDDDLHVYAGAPGVDAGTNSLVTYALDLDGLPRVSNEVVDIGAYEIQFVNQPPIADAGADQTVEVAHDGNPVTNTANFTIDGSASSDPENGPLEVAWTENGNPVGSLMSISLSRPAGTYVFELTVTDEHGASDSDSVTVIVEPEPNSGPVADAGNDQSVAPPHDQNPVTNTADFTLDGSGSYDVEGDALGFEWTEAGNPIGSGATLSLSRQPGTYAFTLTVTDSYGTTDTDEIVVVVNPEPNGAPVANAGSDQNVPATGAMTAVTLDGTESSDPDVDPLTYAWYAGVTLVATGDNPTVELSVGTHTLTLVVTDSYGASSSDDVSVTVGDLEAPVISGVSATPNTLWPPDGTMRTVVVSYSVSDNVDPNPTTWLTVTSSEPATGGVPDIQIVDAHTVLLRAKRLGRTGGRTYTITIHARDATGNESTATVTVVVPHNL